MSAVGVRVEGHGVDGGLLVLLGEDGLLGLDVVLGVRALRVLDKVLLRDPVGVGHNGADAVEEAAQAG